MTTHFPEPFDILKIHPPQVAFDTIESEVLMHAEGLELLRLVIGTDHRLSAEGFECGLITIQCVEGRVEVTSADLSRQLGAGELLYFSATTKHSLRGIENAILLVMAVRCPIQYQT
jgi:hypothetical protein